jgi:hypothetical protein
VTTRRLVRSFWIGAAGALVLAGLIAISMLLRGEISDSDWQTLLTILALIVSAGTAVAGLTVAERGRVWVGRASVAVAGVAFFLIATSIWNEFDDDTLGMVAATAAFALVATLVGVTQLVLHRGGHAWVLVITWLALLAAFLASTSALWSESSEDTWKVAASCWIVGVVGWLNLPVLQRFSAAAAAAGERLIAELDGVEVIATRSRTGLVIDLAPGERLVLRRRD